MTVSRKFDPSNHMVCGVIYYAVTETGRCFLYQEMLGDGAKLPGPDSMQRAIDEAEAVYGPDLGKVQRIDWAVKGVAWRRHPLKR